MSKEVQEKISNSEENSVYDDWSYNLNTFVQKIDSKNTVFLNVSSIDYKTLFKNNFRPDSDYSLLFLKVGEKAFYAKDAIVEKYVYKYKEAYFNNTEDKIKIKDLIGRELNPKKNDISSILKWLGLEEIDLKLK